MVDFHFATGALNGIECNDIDVTIVDNIITAVSGVMVVIVDFGHGNMGCWKGDDGWTINIFQEDGPDSVIYSTAGMELDAGENGMEIYHAMHDLVEYDPYYWE